MNRYITQKTIMWCLMGGIALFLRYILGFFPHIIEQYYSNGIFLSVRAIIDNLLAWLPFPLLYIFFTVLAIVLIKRLIGFIQWKDNWKVKTIRAITSIIGFWMGVVFFFLALWGYNYGRISLEEKVGLDTQPLSKEELWAELQRETAEIIALRQTLSISNDSIPLGKNDIPENQSSILRDGLEEALSDMDYSTFGKVRAKLIYPKGIFLYFSSSGLYFPLTGEGHVDAGLHPLQMPYVMTHEMGHGYGFGDEGTCNFLGYLGCIYSDHPFTQYAGHLAYWRTLAVNYQRYDYDQYWEFRHQLPMGIQADLDAINQTLRNYPDIMPGARYIAYNTYLKAQGIKEGMKNYNRVIMLVHAWQNHSSRLKNN